MSKYRIPSTSSTLDPYDVQRRIAGDTLKPTASQVETSTVGNELETLTPFQIEEGKGTLGNSQYQQQALQNQLANDEDFWSLTAKGLKNLAGTVLTEVGKTPGYIGGGLAAAGDGSGQEQGMLQAVAEDRAQREDWGCAPGDEQPSAKGGGCGAPQALLMYARSKY